MDKLRVTILAVVLALASGQDLNRDCGGKDFKCVGISQYLSCADYGDGNLLAVEGSIQNCPHDMMCNDLDENPCSSAMVPEPTTSTAPTSTADPATLKDEFEHTEPIGSEDNAEPTIVETKSAEEAVVTDETLDKEPSPAVEGPAENANNENPIEGNQDSQVGEQKLVEEQTETETVVQKIESVSEGDDEQHVEAQTGIEEIETTNNSEIVVEENSETEVEAVEEPTENETITEDQSVGEQAANEHSENDILAEDTSDHQAPDEEPQVSEQASVNEEPEEAVSAEQAQTVEITEAAEVAEVQTSGTAEEETKEPNSENSETISTPEESVQEGAEVNEGSASETSDLGNDNTSSADEVVAATEQNTDVQSENNETTQENTEEQTENKEESVTEEITADSSAEAAAQETTDETHDSQEPQNPTESTPEETEASATDELVEENKSEAVAGETNETGVSASGETVSTGEHEETTSETAASKETTEEAQPSENVDNNAEAETTLPSSAESQAESGTASEAEANEAESGTTSETETNNAEPGEVPEAEANEAESGTTSETETNNAQPGTAPEAEANEAESGIVSETEASETESGTVSEAETNEAESSTTSDAESLEVTTASPEEAETTAAEVTTEGNEPAPTTTIPPCTAPGAHAYEGDCKRYFICLGSLLGYYRVEATCPPRFAFSARKMRCTRDVAPCGGLECEAAGNIADPEDPTRYFWCVPSITGEYQKYHIQCPSFQRFDSALERCTFDPDHLFEANHEVIEAEEDEHSILKAEKEWLKKEEKRISSEEKRLEKDKKRREKEEKDRLKELEKEEKRKIKEEEKARKQLEKLRQKLNSNDAGNVSADSDEKVPLFTCTGEGTFPDPDCCEKYFICWEKKLGKIKLSHLKCPPGYFFDSERMICANDGLAKCA